MEGEVLALQVSLKKVADLVDATAGEGEIALSGDIAVSVTTLLCNTFCHDPVFRPVIALWERSAVGCTCHGCIVLTHGDTLGTSPPTPSTGCISFSIITSSCFCCRSVASNFFLHDFVAPFFFSEISCCTRLQDSGYRIPFTCFPLYIWVGTSQTEDICDGKTITKACMWNDIQSEVSRSWEEVGEGEGGVLQLCMTEFKWHEFRIQHRRLSKWSYLNALVRKVLVRLS